MENDHLARLIEEMSGSLHRELKQVEARLDGVDRRLDDIAKTQKRHSALFSADAMAVRGMERTVLQHDEAIAELRERIHKLEGGRPN